MLAVVVNPDHGLLKIFTGSLVNVDKCLRVAVRQRKPGALYLHHNAMSFFKGVRYVAYFIADTFYFSRCKRFRFFVAVTVAAPEDLTMYQHFITTHRVHPYRIFFII